MSTIYHVGNGYEILTKGAPESILPQSTHILDKGKIRPITSQDKEQIEEQMKNFAQGAMRVLAFAYKQEKNYNKQTAESDLVFVGLQAIIDPAREEVKDAIAICTGAGIRVVMIT